MHKVGYYFHDLIVAAAAAGGAVGSHLNLVKSLFHLVKLSAFVNNLFYVVQSDMLAVAYDSVFHAETPLKIF